MTSLEDPTLWDRRFLDRAEDISRWSKDPSTKVGAIAVIDRMEIASGYNGLPRGVADTYQRLHDRETKLLMTAHAETNLLAHAARQGVKLKGCTVYVTMFPCSHCAGLLINAGVARIVVPRERCEFPERWLKSFTASHDMLREAMVTLESVITLTG